jgi:hypothetical protein
METMGLIGLGWLVYSFICVCLAAYVGAEKNRPDWEPYVFGFLLGPIGVLIMAVLPTMPPKPRSGPKCRHAENSSTRCFGSKARNEQRRWASVSSAGRRSGFKKRTLFFSLLEQGFSSHNRVGQRVQPVSRVRTIFRPFINGHRVS